jgi:hypothetical protein
MVGGLVAVHFVKRMLIHRGLCSEDFCFGWRRFMHGWGRWLGCWKRYAAEFRCVR